MAKKNKHQKETEYLLISVQNNAMSTYYMKAKIDNMQQMRVMWR